MPIECSGADARWTKGGTVTDSPFLLPMIEKLISCFVANNLLGGINGCWSTDSHESLQSQFKEGPPSLYLWNRVDNEGRGWAWCAWPSGLFLARQLRNQGQQRCKVWRPLVCEKFCEVDSHACQWYRYSSFVVYLESLQVNGPSLSLINPIEHFKRAGLWWKYWHCDDGYNYNDRYYFNWWLWQ